MFKHINIYIYRNMFQAARKLNCSVCSQLSWFLQVCKSHTAVSKWAEREYLQQNYCYFKIFSWFLGRHKYKFPYVIILDIQVNAKISIVHISFKFIPFIIHNKGLASDKIYILHMYATGQQAAWLKYSTNAQLNGL